MCITRVAKIVSLGSGNQARARFLDDGAIREIDVSMVKVNKNSYVEVFADAALSRLSNEEAKWRKGIWLELRQLRRATLDKE